MFDRFTDEAKTSINLGRQRVAEHRTDRFEPVHILVGICRAPDAFGMALLRSCGIDSERFAALVEARAATLVGETRGLGMLPFTPGAKRVLEYGVEEASAHGHRKLGTHHLLLAALRVDAEAQRVLAEQSVSVDAARKAMAELHATAFPNDREGAEASTLTEPSRHGLQAATLHAAALICRELKESGLSDKLRELARRLVESGDSETRS